MKKRLLNIATLLIILLMVLSLASCNGTDKAPNSDLNNGAGDPNKNQASSGSGASSASASESKSASESVSEPQKEEKYSEVLQYVLNNKEYNNLIKEAKSDPNINTNDAFYLGHHFENTPYGFYEDQGYNIQALKNNQMESVTVVYTKPDEKNNLYVNTRIESQGATPYFTQYILRYKLSDKEMDEFVWLHKNKYIQAQFMVDAISQTRKPEILSECKITVSAQNNLVDSLGQYELTKSLLNDITLSDVTILSFDVEAGTCTLMIASKQSLMSMSTAGYQNVITIGNGSKSVRATVDGAYAGPSGLNTYTYSEELNTSEPTQITFFNQMFNVSQTQILKI